MNKLASIISCLVIFLAMSAQSYAADLDGLVSSLKGGGYVLVFRHGATDDSQKDVYPFKFDDMTAQRQLSEKGRSMARELGEALKKLGRADRRSLYEPAQSSRRDRQAAWRQGRLSGGRTDRQRRGQFVRDGQLRTAGTPRPDAPCAIW